MANDPLMSDASVERVARVVCLSAGYAPDEMVFNVKHLPIGAKGHCLAPSYMELVPSWQLYVYEARSALAEVVKIIQDAEKQETV